MNEFDLQGWEREIQAFVSEEYWSLTASLTPQPPKKRFPFDAKFVAALGSLHGGASPSMVENAPAAEGGRYTISSADLYLLQWRHICGGDLRQSANRVLT